MCCELLQNLFSVHRSPKILPVRIAAMAIGSLGMITAIAMAVFFSPAFSWVLDFGSVELCDSYRRGDRGHELDGGSVNFRFGVDGCVSDGDNGNVRCRLI